MSSVHNPTDETVLTYHEYRAGEEASNRKDALRERIKQTIDDGHEAQSKGRYYELAQILENVLIPVMNVDRWSLFAYDRRLAGTPYGWNWEALTKFFEDTERYLSPNLIGDRDRLEARMRRGETPEEHRRRVLDGVFESLESVAIIDGYLPNELEDEQPSFAYQHQLGVRYLRADSPVGGDLDLIDTDGELKATLLTGSQGSGKSTALETIVEDRIANGHKIVDVVDFFKSENSMYDVENQDEFLDGIRDELGLDTGFEDYDPPDVEILLPLTPELEDTQIPFNTETGEPVVKPFTIPASDLTYKQLIMLLPHTTKTHENYLKSAHEYLKRTGKDWTLRDVSEVVRTKTNAGDTVADRIERSLETAQQKSFIRDKQCEYQLDWDDMMLDQQTVSAFTAHVLKESSDKLLLMSYLLDCIYEERNRLIRRRTLQDYPTMSLVMRELHKVAPRQKSEQENESTIEGYMIDTLSEVFALMRHVKMEILADTQMFHQQLSPQVSGLFHRIYCFGGTKPDVRKVFSTRVDDTDPVEQVSQFETGRCALVSENGYKMPIQFAPPRCHHLDADRDGDGFSMRTQVLENEELKDSPYDAEIPQRLAFQTRSKDPLDKFLEKFIRYTGDREDYAFKEDITEAYNSYADVNGYDLYGHDEVNKRVKGMYDLSDDTDARPTHPESGKRKSAHRTIDLTW